MTPTELIAAFDALADAPKGVARLRDLVLQLAVRGKLVAQDPHAEPASVRLDDRMILPESFPYSLPNGWAWSCLRLLGKVIGGGTPSKTNSHYWDGGIPWVTPKDMKRDRIADTIDHITDSAVAGSAAKRIPHTALLMVVRGMILAHSFPTALSDVEVTINQDMKALVPFDEELAPFLLVLTKGSKQRVLKLVERSTHGTCKLDTQDLLRLPIPIAPWAEQRQIVARVDDLMGLLDRLEAARAKRETTRTAARDSVLAALREAESPAEVDVAWTRFAQRMDDLVCDPADIAPLRQTVLQLAVRGRLVRQSAGDEPADELLKRIAKERARLKRKEREPDSNEVVSLSEVSVPFAIPRGWAWSRLGSILIECRNGTSASPNDSGVGYPVLRISACTSRQDASVDLTDCKFAELPEALALPYFVQPGDLLACRYNGNLRYVGRVALVPEGRHQPTLYPDKLIRLRALEVEHGYLRIAINAGSTRKQIESVAATTAGNIGINGKQMQALLVPLPPLAEQHRIVARVEELMGLLDRLEARLVAEKTVHKAFSAAAVHHLETWRAS